MDWRKGGGSWWRGRAGDVEVTPGEDRSSGRALCPSGLFRAGQDTVYHWQGGKLGIEFVTWSFNRHNENIASHIY